MKIAILQALVLAVALFGGAASAAPKASSQAACAVGAQVLAAEVAAGAKVFDAEGTGAGFLFTLSATRLPEAIRTVVAGRAPRNLFQACPALIGRLPAGARMVTPAERTEVKGIRLITGVYVTTLSEPVLSRDGRLAVIQVASRCAGLCGHGGLYPYRKAAGRWTRGEPIVLMLS